MGAQWKHAGKMDAANRKGKLVGKLVKEIMVATKMGGTDPASNARLRAALEDARKNSVTKDAIERAIKRGAGQTDDGVTFSTLTYEGFAPHQVPVIVECLTENNNRTAGEIRVLFRKGQLGNSGAVAWMFDRVGIVEATIPKDNIDIEEAAIEAGAQNVESMDKEDVPEGNTGAVFYAEPSDLDAVNKALTERSWAISKAELGYVAKNMIDLAPDARKEVEQFLGDINDYDDVHRVYTAIR
ncbi:MAG: YebC/PmpR family DNA-binding transcriptional regulator [bacterium]|jgi:YebC/PmpR family DNA-binding regulatory protein